MRYEALRLLDLEGIVESVLEDAASDFVTRALDFVFANFLAIILIVIVLLAIIGIVVMNKRNQYERNEFKRLKELFKQKDLELDQLMLSEAFKEMESGLVQGNTRNILVKLEERLLASHRYSEQLSRKLEAYRVSRFSVSESAHRIGELQDEVYSFAEQVDQYASELAQIKRVSKQTASLVQPVQTEFAEVVQIIARIADTYSYPLDELKKRQEQVEAIVAKAAQSGSFDAVRAQSDAREARKAIEELRARTLKLDKDIALFGQMKQRIEERQSKLTEQAPDELIHQLERTMRELEHALQSGAEVDLRSAALDMERIINPH